jgi:hypothetical protein
MGGWLAVSGEFEREAALVCAQIQIAWHKFGALIDPNRYRQSHFSPDSFEHPTTSARRKLKQDFTSDEKWENLSTIVRTRSFQSVASWSV